MKPPSRQRALRPRAGWWSPCAALLTLVLLPAHASGAEPPDAETQLGRVREAIAGLQREIEATRQDRGQASRALEEHERAIDRIARERRRLDGRAVELDAELARLHRLREELGVRVAAEREVLGRHLRVAYALGREDRLKLLLLRREPSSIARLLRYHRVLGHERSERIAALQSTLERVAVTGEAIARESARLARVRAEQVERQQALERERARRETALAALEAQLADGRTRLDALERDRRRLGELVKRLRDVISDIPSELEPPRSFAALRGRLPWPVAGRVAKRFGSPRADLGIDWQGVVLEAPAGREVRAVAHGRVVFADWLRGFGLMIILDHGDGYMSLYGHNESLLREPGEWVNPGDPLATVGDSGSHSRAGLYFEIRREGRPQNPSRWCSAKATFRAAL